jgi:uncharacterized membrane protein SpoIIM required for sporulation
MHDRLAARRQEDWRRLEHLIGRAPRDGVEVGELSRLYRSVAADLALASAADADHDITRYLDQLASRAHNRLYGSGRIDWGDPLRLVVDGFPRALRRNALIFAVASVLFYGPFLLGLVACLIDPSLAERVLPMEQLLSMEAMYAEGPTDRGGTAADAGMAGFYVFNNIGIALRCFATGALGGLGSLYFLVYNGAVLGTSIGYVLAGPGASSIATFIVGHGTWELMGIVVAGTAGLRLGWAILVPGAQSRTASLREARHDLLALVVGAIFLLAVAAAIEGFWSASPIPVAVKWAFGLVQPVVIGLWLLLGGRR